MHDPLLSAEEVGEWINESPQTVSEWGKIGKDLFPYPEQDELWKRSHIQQWLESQEDQNVEFIQSPETQETLHAQKHPQEFRGDEGNPL